MMDFALYILLGSVAGLLGGMLGIGGGLIVVPGLVFMWSLQDQSPDLLTHMAVATSLASIVVTSISAVYEHQRRGAVRWDIVRTMTPALMFGAFAGAQIAHHMDGRILQIIFGAFALLMAAQMAFDWKAAAHRPLPAGVGLFSTGTAIGAASSVFGIGGGSITVPFLAWNRIPMAQASATASACGMPIAFTGALGFVAAGWHLDQLPIFTLGYIHLPAFIGISCTSFITARLGAKLAYQIPAANLKRLFALVLLAVAIEFIVGIK